MRLGFKAWVEYAGGREGLGIKWKMKLKRELEAGFIYGG